MRADESDVDDAIGIIDPDHDAVLVAGDVEDCTAILQDTGAPDIPFDVRGERYLFTIDLNPLSPASLPAYVRDSNLAIIRDERDLRARRP
jgi:hypothetical protein